MKNLRCMTLVISFIFSTNIFPSEGGLWAVISTWPGCIGTAVVSCCCLKMCCNRLAEGDRREAIRRRYENRSSVIRFSEAIGIIRYDHGTGRWLHRDMSPNGGGRWCTRGSDGKYYYVR